MIRASLHIHIFLCSVIFSLVLTASMRFLWPVSVLATLVSMGLLVMIIGQKSVITMLNGAIEKQEVKLDGLNAQYINQEFVKVTVEKLVAQVIKMVEELQATVAKLSPELEKKKAQTDSCKAEKVIPPPLYREKNLGYMTRLGSIYLFIYI